MLGVFWFGTSQLATVVLICPLFYTLQRLDQFPTFRSWKDRFSYKLQVPTGKSERGYSLGMVRRRGLGLPPRCPRPGRKGFPARPVLTPTRTAVWSFDLGSASAPQTSAVSGSGTCSCAQSTTACQ